MEPRWNKQRRERGEFPQAQLRSLVRFGRDCRTRRIGILVNELRVGRVSLPRLSLVVHGVEPKPPCSRCCTAGASAPPLPIHARAHRRGLRPPPQRAPAGRPSKKAHISEPRSGSPVVHSY